MDSTDSPESRRDAAAEAFRSVPVRSRMRRDFVTLRVTDSLAEALSVMRLARLRHVPIESEGVLAGLLSYRQLQDFAIDRLRANGSAPPEQTLDRITVASAMLEVPIVLDPDDGLGDAADQICQLGMGCLPVVEQHAGEARLVGLITESDLLLVAFGAR